MALPRNSPVPMVLPRPSMASCAGLSLRSRPDPRATMVAARLSSTAISEGSSLMGRHPNRNLTFVLLLASFELDVRTVNERNTDPLKKRSLLVSCTLESEAWRGTGTRRHGGRHETPARFDCHLHRHVFRCDSGIVAKFRERRDRKSTRLNSSHGYISYAVFCLKKKKKKTCTHICIQPLHTLRKHRYPRYSNHMPFRPRHPSTRHPYHYRKLLIAVH